MRCKLNRFDSACRARSGRWLALASLVALSCDQGEPRDLEESVPPLRLTGASVSRDRPVPANGDIGLVFNRLLLPIAVTRQSIAIVDTANTAAFPVMRYDPLRRLVTLANPEVGGAAWLTPGQPYRIVVGIPEGRSILGGIRAFDGAKIQAGTPRQIGFFATPQAPIVAVPRVSFCKEIDPLLREKCGSCHGKEHPAAGLDLTTSEGIVRTALGRVAHASNRGGSVRLPADPDQHFGSDMAIIDPESPGTSYLVYKLLLDPSNGKPMTGSCGSVAPYPSWSVSDDDRRRLRERIIGHGMTEPALTEDETSAISQWIGEGAIIEACENCRAR